jgi:HEAT repeat protein
MIWGRSRGINVEKLKNRHDLAGLVAAFAETADAEVGAAAGDALVALEDLDCVPLLMEALGDGSDRDLQNRTAALLRRIGPPALMAVVKFLAYSDPADPAVARAVLIRVGMDAPGAIADLLHQTEVGTRDVVADVLVKLGAIAEDAVVALLSDPSLSTQNAAADVIGRMGMTSIEPVLEMMLSPNKRVQTMARKTLQRFGESAIPPLVDMLQNPREEVARQAGEILATLGPPVVDALLALLGSEAGQASHVQVAAIRVLGHMGDVRATDHLISAIGSRHTLVRATALEALGRLGPDAIPMLLAALDNPAHPVPAAVLMAMGRIGDARVLDRLIGALEHEDPAMRSVAVDALADYGPRASAALNTALADGSYWTRKGASEAMRRWTQWSDSRQTSA